MQQTLVIYCRTEIWRKRLWVKVSRNSIVIDETLPRKLHRFRKTINFKLLLLLKSYTTKVSSSIFQKYFRTLIVDKIFERTRDRNILAQYIYIYIYYDLFYPTRRTLSTIILSKALIFSTLEDYRKDS